MDTLLRADNIFYTIKHCPGPARVNRHFPSTAGRPHHEGIKAKCE
jgi:hypothetical protein